MLGPLREDLASISTKSPDTDARTSQKGFDQGPRRSSQKDLCKIMQRPLEEHVSRIFARSSHKALYKIMQGPLRKGFVRIFTTSSQQGLLQDLGHDFHKDPHAQ